jgi:hypothetical protein
MQLAMGPKNGTPNKEQMRRMSMAMMPFSLVNSEQTTKEEVTVPECKAILHYVNDTDLESR